MAGSKGGSGRDAGSDGDATEPTGGTEPTGKDLSGPSLTLPSMPGLGSLRRRRKSREDAPEPEAQPEPEPEETLADALLDVEPEDEPADWPADGPRDEDSTTDAPAAPAARRPRPSRPSLPARPELTLPSLPGPAAAVASGIVVGLLMVGLTFGASRGCEAVRGTSSCGGGLGLTALVLILAAAIVVGGWLLRSFGVADGGSTSFLAVGIVAVVVLLLLVDVLDAWWMVLAIPAVGAAAYALAHWLTTTFAREAADG